MAQEGIEKAKKMQEAVLAKAAARKQKELAGKTGLDVEEDPDEVRKQKILNMMMGGKKGNTAKFFKAWVVGTGMARKERRIAERESAWRRNCGAHDPSFPGGCSACARLGESVLDFALDSFLHTDDSKMFRSNMGRTYQGTLKEIPQSKSTSFLPTIDADTRRADWFQGDLENVAHYKNGKKYQMDTSSMKIRQIPPQDVLAAFAGSKAKPTLI